ncbi:MAG: D-alanine--poly(phosphoribitol) ligase, subunit 1 [Verrucomicrobiota bacterium]|jgi:D-alanine--poly(phosphoribitol) ligase subunit 1
MHLLDQIAHWVRATPDRVAQISNDRTITYGELGTRSDALAAWLDRELGDRRVPVAIHGHKEPEMLVTFLAAVKTGRPYVPIDISTPQARVERVVEISEAGVLLTPENVAALSAGGAAYEAARKVGEGDPFYILFTSGSTGEPKGVVITLANLNHYLAWMRGAHDFTLGAEVFLNHAPFTFDLSVHDIYLALSTGGTIFSLTKDVAADFRILFEALRKCGATQWMSTPSFAQMCMIERGFSQQMLPTMRRFFFCGETLAPETASQMLERFPDAEIFNTYGPTEATVAVTSVRVTRELIGECNPLPIGHVMPGTEIIIRGENGQAVAPGERGEIVIAGPNVSPGYLRRPDLTEKVFAAHGSTRLYRTGDWGRDRGGMVFCEGRMDNQIKLHGHRIELGDMESNLRALDEIADAVVLPVKKGDRIDSVAAFVVLRGAKQGSDFEQAAKLKTKLGERVPPYMVPRKFIFLESFPMNTNGKADRKALAAQLG